MAGFDILRISLSTCTSYLAEAYTGGLLWLVMACYGLLFSSLSGEISPSLLSFHIHSLLFLLSDWSLRRTEYPYPVFNANYYALSSRVKPLYSFSSPRHAIFLLGTLTLLRLVSPPTPINEWSCSFPNPLSPYINTFLDPPGICAASLPIQKSSFAPILLCNI
jgi:hypothetical protein